jgi:hypothetical protein
MQFSLFINFTCIFGLKTGVKIIRVYYKNTNTNSIHSFYGLNTKTTLKKACSLNEGKKFYIRRQTKMKMLWTENKGGKINICCCAWVIRRIFLGFSWSFMSAPSRRWVFFMEINKFTFNATADGIKIKLFVTKYFFAPSDDSLLQNGGRFIN